MLTIAIKQAHLSYCQHQIFADFNMELAAGKWTCLLGPSGVGKSSLLRLIANFQPYNKQTLAGQVSCSDGGDVAGRLAYVPQQCGLMPWRSALANVLLAAELAGLPAKDYQKRGRQLLIDLGLRQQLNTRADKLSGGQRQRVALARALLLDRPVVLLDEPFNGLDFARKQQLYRLFSKHLQNRTVLMVTHDPWEALQLGHDIHILSGRPARISASFSQPRAYIDLDGHDSCLADYQDICQVLLAGADDV